MESKRTIRVTGKGTLKLRPDLTRLTLTLQGKDADYGETLRRSTEQTETLRCVLEKLGFVRDALKTLQFSVDTLYEGYQDEHGNYQNRFVGYQFQHTLKIEFPSDNALLGRTLYALAHCDAAPEFRIGYTVSEPEAAKNALLEQAVRDARAKAELLSAAAGTKLGDILNINYSWGEADFEVRPMHKMLAAENCVAARAAGSYDMNIEPDDVSVSDTVTVLWEIKGE